MTDPADQQDAKPTPRPWHNVNADEAIHEWVVGDSEGGSLADFSPPGPWMLDDVATANMRLALTAVNALDQLLVANAALVGALSAAKNILETLRKERLPERPKSQLAIYVDDRDRIAQAVLKKARAALKAHGPAPEGGE